MDISYSGLIGPRLRKEMPMGVEQLRVLPRRSWKMIGMAMLLIVFRDLQAVMHIWHRRDWMDNLLAGVWIVLFVGMIVAAIGEFFGFEVFSVGRGELMVRRGIGPISRTFHFPVGGIRELVGSDPTDKEGKRHLGNILLKPKAGAVRFECDGKTHYFGDSIDEADGEAIVRWLRPKLPKTATDPLPIEKGGAENFEP